MIRIPCKCQGFDPIDWTQLQGNYKLDIEWHDLVWAAISVGKLGYDDLMAHGQFSIDEMRYRSYLIYSHLMQIKNRVRRSPLYESLDSTEKGAASYFVGMAASKLVGAFMLDIPWLVHLEKINSLFNIGLQGNSRPDLLGLNSQGQWAVFEAKGRTGGFSLSALNKAKTQTRQIRHISGQVPKLRVATEAFFNPCLSMRIVDPKGHDDAAIDVKTDVNQFYSSYYNLFRNIFPLFPDQNAIGLQDYRFSYNQSTGISVGINRRILYRLEHNELNPETMRDYSSRVGKIIHENNRATKYYPDGIAVGLDEHLWNSDTMALEPSKRR